MPLVEAAPIVADQPEREALRLSDVIGALTCALDLTEGQPPGHSLRCTWIGMHIGRVLGLTEGELADLYYMILLKDTGCSSNAARLWELYGGDERLIKRDFKTVDTDSTVGLARFVLAHTGPGEPLRRRVERLFNLARNGDELAGELIQTRCERGAGIVLRLGFGQAVADGIYALDEHWNGNGKPRRLRGEAIPLGARIALLSQVTDVFHAVGGPAAALAEAGRRAGSWFDPRVVAALRAAAGEAGFWRGLDATGLAERVAALEPIARVMPADPDRLDVVAEAFADIIDAKSAFTGGHSRRVTDYADAIAGKLGWAPARRRWLRRAALLHDIGKLGVSTGILDKPSRLNNAEWAAMKRHASLSEEILSLVPVFRDIAGVAGAHHERLDGKGYPRGLKGQAIPPEAQVITTSDIFDAITAKRPYREPMPLPDAVATLERERGVTVEGACLTALWDALPQFGLPRPTP